MLSKFSSYYKFLKHKNLVESLKDSYIYKLVHINLSRLRLVHNALMANKGHNEVTAESVMLRFVSDASKNPYFIKS